MTMKNKTKCFSGDWHYNCDLNKYDHVFECLGFGNTWNGWATPIVNRKQLASLVEVEPDLSFNDDGNLVYVSPEYALDETFIICPNGNDLFHLIDLGWCFDELTENEA